jgi:hypothetical protein
MANKAVTADAPRPRTAARRSSEGRRLLLRKQQDDIANSIEIEAF